MIPVPGPCIFDVVDEGERQYLLVLGPQSDMRWKLPIGRDDYLNLLEKLSRGLRRGLSHAGGNR